MIEYPPVTANTLLRRLLYTDDSQVYHYKMQLGTLIAARPGTLQPQIIVGYQYTE